MKYLVELVFAFLISDIWLIILFGLSLKEIFYPGKGKIDPSKNFRKIKVNFKNKPFYKYLWLKIMDVVGFEALAVPLAFELSGVIFGNILLFISLVIAAFWSLDFIENSNEQPQQQAKEEEEKIICYQYASFLHYSFLSIFKRSILLNITALGIIQVLTDIYKLSLNKTYLIYWTNAFCYIYLAFNEVKESLNFINFLITTTVGSFAGVIAYYSSQNGFAKYKLTGSGIDIALGVIVLLNIFFVNEFGTKEFEEEKRKSFKDKNDYRIVIVLSYIISYIIYALFGNFMFFLKGKNTYNAINVVKTLLIILVLFRECNNRLINFKLQYFDLYNGKLY